MKKTALLLSTILLYLWNTTFGQPIIIDHNCSKLEPIPEWAVLQARDSLHIAYGHTSHGSQLMTGMTGLDAQDTNLVGYKGDIYCWDYYPQLYGTFPCIDIHDYFRGGDLGHNGDTTWASSTRDYLENDPNSADINVIMWSWCGGCSDNTVEGIQIYLDKMNELEQDYPDIKFVYMTGHRDIWNDDTLKRNNQLIRDYCIANDKILFDFADIESYDPDGNYYEYANDNCDYYDENMNCLGNWATEWQNSHTEGVDWYYCYAAHSKPLNGNMKAYASWWMFCRIAGWDGSHSGFVASPGSINFGKVSINSVVYDTFEIINSDTMSIVIDSLIVDDPAFSLSLISKQGTSSDITGFTLGVGETQEVQVSFLPEIAKNYSDTITIYSTQSGNENVFLSGEGVFGCGNYCSSTFSNTTDDWIANVTFNTIDKNSGKGGIDSYEDFSNITTIVTPGTTYPISVTINMTGNWNHDCFAFIDWNQDCDFDDTGESFDLGAQIGTGTLTSSITIPANAQAGYARMRIVEQRDQNPGACNPHESVFGETEDYTLLVGNELKLGIKVFLEGPFNGSDMNTDIHGIMPLSQPYNVAPWNYQGTESRPSFPPVIVDWVLVELRDTSYASLATGETMVARQAALLTDNGQIVNINGSSILYFDHFVNQSLFVVIWHRNHLAIMSANPLTESSGIYTYDFTTAIDQAYNSGQKDLGGGHFGMIAADANADGVVSDADKNLWNGKAGKIDYLPEDFDMDGQVDNKDKDDIWILNDGVSDAVPQ